MLAVFSFSKPVINGWHWRTITLTVAAIALLQVVLDQMTRHYSVVATAPLGVLFVGYIIIPKVKERRVANALVGVIAVFVIDLILQLGLDFHGLPPAGSQRLFLEDNLMSLVLGALVCFGYTKLTEWSERKRGEREAKRRVQTTPTESYPQRRHHNNKNRRKRHK